MKMNVSTTNSLYCCSCLILGFKHKDEDYTLESFTQEYVENVRLQSGLYGIFCSHLPTHYAFINVETSHTQPGIEKILREIGFQESKRVFKKKNPGNGCKFWTIAVEDFYEALGMMTPEIKKCFAQNREYIPEDVED